MTVVISKTLCQRSESSKDRAPPHFRWHSEKGDKKRIAKCRSYEGRQAEDVAKKGVDTGQVVIAPHLGISSVTG